MANSRRSSPRGNTPRGNTHNYSPNTRKKLARIKKRKLKQRRANWLLAGQVIGTILVFALLGMLIFSVCGPKIDKNQSNFWFTVLYALGSVSGLCAIVLLGMRCMGIFSEEDDEEEAEPS